MTVEPLSTVDADTLLSSPLPQTVFLVEELLPQGVHILCGASKIGKSWLVLWLALQVAQGLPVWGLKTLPCKVLYLGLEDTLSRIQDRLFRLTDQAPPTLRIGTLCHQLDHGLQNQIEQYLFSFSHTKLIIIDTFQKIRDNTISRGSLYAADYKDMSLLKQLADRYNLCILLVHHLRKLTDTADPFNEVSGSTGLQGAADSTFILKRSNRASDEAILLATGRDIEYQQLTLRFSQFRWHLVSRKDATTLAKEAIPPFLFRLADFVRQQKHWEGSATALLAAMGETEVTANNVVKLIARYWECALDPMGITYTSHRTAAERRISLTVTHDDNDSNDGKYPI